MTDRVSTGPLPVSSTKWPDRSVANRGAGRATADGHGAPILCRSSTFAGLLVVADETT
jgi:hypothetical protein